MEHNTGNTTVGTHGETTLGTPHGTWHWGHHMWRPQGTPHWKHMERPHGTPHWAHHRGHQQLCIKPTGFLVDIFWRFTSTTSTPYYRRPGHLTPWTNSSQLHGLYVWQVIQYFYSQWNLDSKIQKFSAHGYCFVKITQHAKWEQSSCFFITKRCLLSNILFVLPPII